MVSVFVAMFPILACGLQRRFDLDGRHGETFAVTVCDETGQFS